MEERGSRIDRGRPRSPGRGRTSEHRARNPQGIRHPWRGSTLVATTRTALLRVLRRAVLRWYAFGRFWRSRFSHGTVAVRTAARWPARRRRFAAIRRAFLRAIRYLLADR